MNIFEFISGSPVTSIIILALFLQTFLWALGRFLRTVNLWKNGYPPEHLDADGDFKE